MTDQNVKVNIPSNPGPGCLVRGLYFIFVGSWLGAIWMLIAWFLNVTIIGLPLGLAMLNRLPQIMTLRPERMQTTVVTRNGNTYVNQTPLPQRSFIGRAFYFILIGWWFSLIWMIIAWLIAGITLGLGLPVAFWMFDRVPEITTLARI
ncbi:MAG: YccF domain-containing protein [Anaerolineaceae bacterium]|nr:YccF domain-containing protein [Anaerolineaceae bacterium]